MARKKKTNSRKKTAVKKNSYYYTKRKREREAREGASARPARQPSRRRYVRKNERETLQQHLYAVTTLKSYLGVTEAKLVERAQSLLADAITASAATGKLTISVDASKDERYRMLSRCILLAKEILSMEEGVVAEESATVQRVAAERKKKTPPAETPAALELSEAEMAAIVQQRAEAALAGLPAKAPAAEKMKRAKPAAKVKA